MILLSTMDLLPIARLRMLLPLLKRESIIARRMDLEQRAVAVPQQILGLERLTMLFSRRLWLLHTLSSSK